MIYLFGVWILFCLGIDYLRMLPGVGPGKLGVGRYPLGETNFDDFFAWGLAWGGFAWGCEAGVYSEQRGLCMQPNYVTNK